MKITLRIDGKEKTFINDFVSARVFRKALELNNNFKDPDPNTLFLEYFDALAEFAVSAFGNQFTLDELWDGLPTGKVNDELTRIFHEVLALEGLVVGGVQEEGKPQEALTNQ